MSTTSCLWLPSLFPTQYLNAIWNVINFKEAEKRLEEAL